MQNYITKFKTFYNTPTKNYISNFHQTAVISMFVKYTQILRKFYYYECRNCGEKLFLIYTKFKIFHDTLHFKYNFVITTKFKY